MNKSIMRVLAMLTFVGVLPTVPNLFGASGSATSGSTRPQVEPGGYSSYSTHDEIVNGAKKEGKLRVLGSLSSTTYKAMTAAFKKRYPFADVYFEELTGTDAPQRFLLELKAGVTRDWDVFPMVADYWTEYIPYLKK